MGVTLFTQQPRTNDQFRKAIGKLVRGLEKIDREQHDRRKHHRFYFGVKVNLCTQSDDETFQPLCEAWAVDLSIGGLCCMTQRELNDNDLLYVSFEHLVGKPCYIPIRVRRSTLLIGNVYQIHSQFAYPDDTKEE